MSILLDGKNVSYLTPNDLCGVLGIAKSTLLAWEKSGGVNPPKRGERNTRTYTESDIVDVLRYMAEIKSGNPEYPESLVPMHPEIANLEWTATTITIGILELIDYASS